MARTPTIWFREATGWYMTTVRGRQVKLSPDKAEATRTFHTLMASLPDEPAEQKAAIRPTFRKVADLFLDEGKRTKEPGTYAVQRYYLQSFCDHIKTRRVADLKVHMATEWIASHPDWGQSTCTTARSIVRACLNWAVEQGYIPANPLAKLKRGDFARRERILTRSERQAIAGIVTSAFRDFVFALEQTGCRPFSEMSRVTAAMVDFQAGSITLAKHKNAKRGKARTIYLTTPLIDLLRRLSAEYPTGPLFRTKTGNRWTQGSAAKQMVKACERLKIPRANCYAYRHTYITEALAKGMSASIVAELVGNSPATIHKYYSHLDQRKDELREAARLAAT